MVTTITAERVFDKHAVALGLPAIGDGSFESYVEAHGKTDEGKRCLGLAFEAACVADHDDAHTWLAQARSEMQDRRKAENLQR